MKKYILSFVVFAAVCTLCISADTRSSKTDINKNLNIFTAIFKELQTSYVDTIDANKTMREAIDAMLYSIDPYTEYIPADEQDDFKTISTGEFGGIGAYIRERQKGCVYIDEPQENTPSQKVGLKAGDRIVEIDGKDVRGQSSDKVRNQLRGKAGTIVNVTVIRPYVQDSVLTFEIKREKIDIDPVPFYGMVSDSIGYISLTTFNEKSYKQVREAVETLTLVNGAQSLILDLRGNGGGLLESAVQIVGIFVDKGTEVLRTRGRGALKENVYKTTVKPIDTKIPLVVLVDGGSASSSEIVTGALQDLDRAVIIGSRTFGKGLVQSTRQLPYDGLLKVTISKYYIPSGRLIQAIDYSNRDESGRVTRIPDSLTTVFYTRNHRPVRDGGGITPDITVDYPKYSKLTERLVRDNWVYDYSVFFASKNDSIDVEAFEITDSLYADFRNFVNPAKLDYDKVCETAIHNLEEAAQAEGYMNDEVRMHIDTLKSLLKHDIDKDFEINREQVSVFLESEIYTRMLGSRGAIAKSVKNDDGINAALKMFRTPGRYSEILMPKEE